MRNFFSITLEQVPGKQIFRKFNDLQRPAVEAILQKKKSQVEFSEGYNLEASKQIRPVLNDIPLISVGGWRQVSSMEEVV